MKDVQAIRREVGDLVYDEWIARANHEYDRAEVHDLSRRAYQNMSIRWQYAKLMEHADDTDLRIEHKGGNKKQ